MRSARFIRVSLTSIAVKVWLASLGVALVVGQVPTPESFLGFKVLEDRKLADWQQVLGYFEKVAAAAPDRIKFAEIGKSTLGKPFVMLTISAPENLRQLVLFGFRPQYRGQSYDTFKVFFNALYYFGERTAAAR